MQYTSHKVVYGMLPKRLQELPDSLLDNYIIQCIRQIDAKPMYENKLTMMQVTNGVATLPEDFIKAYGVFYSSKDPTDEELESLMGCIQEDSYPGCISDSPLTDSTDSSTENPTIDTTTPLTLQDRYKLVRIATTDNQGQTTYSYILKGVTFYDYLDSDYFTNCWQPLYCSDKLFTKCFMEKKSPCHTTVCDYKYSFDKCGNLLTSMPDGWIQLAYTGRPTNEDGDYLIPDDMDYIKVLKDGVIMHYYEERRLDQKQGAVNNHREYENKFYNGVAFLRGRSMLPKGRLADKRLLNIIYENISIANDYSRNGNNGWNGGAMNPHLNNNNGQVRKYRYTQGPK